MQRQWWYVNEGARLGPVNPEELAELFSEGPVTVSTLVWTEGMPQWKPMGDFPELLLKPPPPPVSATHGHPPPLPQSGPPPLPKQTPPPLPRFEPVVQSAPALPQTPAPKTNSDARPAPISQTNNTSETPQPPAPYFSPNDGRYGTSAEPVLAQAGAWRRFFARMFDGTVIGLPAYLVLVVVFDVFNIVDIQHVENQGAKSFVVTWVLTVFIGFLSEWGCWALWGTTPGRWFLGLRVVDMQGNKLSTRDYAKRLVGVYLQGFGLGAPVIFVFTMGVQAFLVSQGRPASYDKNKYQVVKVHSPSYGSRMAAGVGQLAVLVAATSLYAFYAHGDDLLEEVSKAVYATPQGEAPPKTESGDTPTARAPPVPDSTPAPAPPTLPRSDASVWRNPVTGSTHEMPSGWTVHEVEGQYGKGQRLARGEEWVFLEVAHRQRAGATLDDHGQAVIQRLSNTWIRVFQDARQVDGRNVWTAQGELLENDFYEMDVLLVNSEMDTHVWQLILHWDNRIENAKPELQGIREKLLSTLPRR